MERFGNDFRKLIDDVISVPVSTAGEPHT
jgi:hypothetical protein